MFGEPCSSVAPRRKSFTTRCPWLETYGYRHRSLLDRNGVPDWSDWKLAVEILVAANPDPRPYIIFETLSNRPTIASHSHGPKPRVCAQPFELQRRMGWILSKFGVCRARGLPDFFRESTIGFPEVWRAARGHECSSKSESRISGKRAGFAFMSSAILSPKAVSAGRERGS